MGLDFENIKKHCLTNSALSKAVFDEYLMNYAADRDNIEREILENLKKYKQVMLELPVPMINFFNAALIAHKVFRKDGYINKYLNRPEIQRLPADQFNYLEWQATHPWFFSFAMIVDEPETDFFTMVDEINGLEYLLYSPGINQTLEDLGGAKPRLWFNLIAFNGQCYQSFGAINYFQGFTWDDLFFFASLVNPSLSDELDFIKTVDKNPFPFQLLARGSNTPMVNARGHDLIIHQSTDQISSLPYEKLEKDFSITSVKGVYRLGLKGYDDFPHFAFAYYNEKKKELVRASFTEVGFEFLSSSLVRAGVQIDPEAEIAVSQSMLTTAEDIFGRKINLNPYMDLFETSKKGSGNNEQLDAINRFMALALNFYNTGTQPDLEKLAAESGIDVETAENIWKTVVKQADKMKKDRGI